MNDDRDMVMALVRGLKLLGGFSQHAQRLSITELAERTCLPKATVARLTYTLSTLGFLQRLPNSKKYSLGAAVLALGNTVLVTLPIRQIAQPFMRKLSDDLRVNVSLSLLNRDNLVYIETCRSPWVHTEHKPDIGVIWPLTDGSPGKAFIAGASEEEQVRFLNLLKINNQDRWPSLSDRFATAISEYQDFGYCSSFGEVISVIDGVAVPVSFPINGNRFVINCAFPASKESAAFIAEKAGPQLKEMIRKVESVLIRQS
ncbi:hypothetical protein ATN89_02415 [Comamonas thiooxydans]|uniref:IclR family transcriptional regulator n=1 Tax=Comamonas thiooxydans TaxID=363952 RepID=UPI0007C490B0|nr:IclR family transcriptional regulator [Comamonas thiooxydans]OAD85585.1 hypothetical protein ATN89_02415 [Comamonas thiooxydans]